MKIAFITLGFNPVRLSGLDISGERLVTELLEMGHVVTVVCVQGSPGDEIIQHPNLKIIRVPLGRSDWIGYSWRVGRLVDQFTDFDLIHFWDIHFAYACTGRFVATVHHSFGQRLNSISIQRDGAGYLTKFVYYQAAKRLAEQPAINRSLGLLAISSTTREELVSKYQVPAAKVALARHGIDTSRFSPVKNTELLRSTLGIPGDRPVLLFLGFITPRKGIDYLLGALSQINSKPTLIIAGSWRSERYRKRVLGRYPGIREQIMEVGFVPDSDLAGLYSLADVFVSSSLLEGFGLPMAESLACETPVVAVNSGASAEVVGPGGLLVPPQDAAAIADGVNKLLTDPGAGKSLGQAGRRHIVAEFSVKRMVSDTMKAYQRFSEF